MSMFYKWGAGRSPGHPVITEAHDEYLVTEEGKEIIDAAAGAAVVNLGHSLDGVAQIMSEQADRVAYVSTSHFTSPSVKSLAEKLSEMAPGTLNNAFLTNSGSEAVETAIKLARDYHVARGNETKETIIGRWQSYHGATLGALSASGNTARRSVYKPLMTDWPKLPPAYPLRWGHGGSPEEQARAAAGELESMIEREGPETVAAFIAEPVSGSSIPAAHPHPVYYQEVRRICDEHDLLFIADEVMVGFGRTGKKFACNHFDVVPDLMSLGKGVAAGYAPISATMIADHVIEALEAAEHSFYHGHTFSGNPVSTAVANHVVDRYTDSLIESASECGKSLLAGLEPLTKSPIIGEVRGIGLMVGIEFVADTATNDPFDPDENVAKRVYDRALENGVYVYPGGGSVNGQAGDHLLLAPPFTIDEHVADRIARTVVNSVDAVAGELGY